MAEGKRMNVKGPSCPLHTREGNQSRVELEARFGLLSATDHSALCRRVRFQANWAN